MIGTKKLSTIREELFKSFSSGGADPIEWLGKQIAAAKRKGGSTEVLEGLKQFLESPPKRKRRQRRAAAKK
jgi:hypothetical protein